VVDLVDENECFLIFILAQVEHDRVFFDEDGEVDKHDDVDENRNEVEKAPELIIDVSLLSFLVLWTIYNFWIIVARGHEIAKTHHQVVAKGLHRVDNGATCAKKIYGDGFIDHLDISHMNHSHEEPVQKLA